MRFATAHWEGGGKDGKGHLTTRSGALKEANYSAGARFGEDPGTNPEELVAAAHAGCFTMKAAFNFSNAGFKPKTLDTRCEVRFNSDKTAIASSKLFIKASVPEITKEKFNELIEDAKKNCPVSKLLNTEISCEASLED